MSGAVISTPNLLFYFHDETVASLTQRWNDWVTRDATVTTRKDQSEDAPGITFEFLRTKIILRPAVTPAVAIAEPRLERSRSFGTKLFFYPFLPWPWPNVVGARFKDDDADVIWLLPRDLTVDDF